MEENKEDQDKKIMEETIEEKLRKLRFNNLNQSRNQLKALQAKPTYKYTKAGKTKRS